MLFVIYQRPGLTEEGLILDALGVDRVFHQHVEPGHVVDRLLAIPQLVVRHGPEGPVGGLRPVVGGLELDLGFHEVAQGFLDRGPVGVRVRGATVMVHVTEADVAGRAGNRHEEALDRAVGVQVVESRALPCARGDAGACPPGRCGPPGSARKRPG